MNFIFHIGRYSLFLFHLMARPEKFEVYRRRIVHETVRIGFGSLGIVAITSMFMGAVITIQTVYNLVNPLVPMHAVGIVTRDSIILEFAPTVISLILAGKVGSSIASEIGTMRVTEQIDALEIMGVNSAGYLVFPKVTAAMFILPFLVVLSMFLGIGGGWFAGWATGAITAHDFEKGLTDMFVPYNVIFALIKSVVFAFLITTVSSYHGFYTSGGAMEVGEASTRAVVFSNISILVFDYILTQVLLL